MRGLERRFSQESWMVELERNHLGPRARLLIVAEALASLL
jgi:hypothetical protein